MIPAGPLHVLINNVTIYGASYCLKCRRFVALAVSLFVPCFHLAEGNDHTYCIRRGTTIRAVSGHVLTIPVPARSLYLTSLYIPSDPTARNTHSPLLHDVMRPGNKGRLKVVMIILLILGSRCEVETRGTYRREDCQNIRDFGKGEKKAKVEQALEQTENA